MITKITYILKISVYIILVASMYIIADRKVVIKLGSNKRRTSHSLSFRFILFFSLAFGLYTLLYAHPPYMEDRRAYGFRFERGEIYDPYFRENSIGLFYCVKFLHLFTHNPQILFIFITFIYLYFTLLAYNEYSEAYPSTLLLLGISQYINFSFFGLKQAPAIALSALAIGTAFTGKWILTALLFVLATIFHESAWIVLPLLIASIGSKRTLISVLQYAALILVTLFFPLISGIIASAFSVISSLEQEIGGYFGELSYGTVNAFTWLKYIPFYFIPFYGFLMKQRLQKTVPHYRELLFISFYTAVASFMSVFMYWMWRLAMFGYFPSFVLASILYKTMNRRKKLIFAITVFGFLGVMTLRIFAIHFFRDGGL